MDDRLVRDSKKLARLLRHSPGSYGCTADEHGWADIDGVIMGMVRPIESLSDHTGTGHCANIVP